MRYLSETARDELLGALARRYAVGTRAEKTRILDEFEAVMGFDRKRRVKVWRRKNATAMVFCEFPSAESTHEAGRGRSGLGGGGKRRGLCRVNALRASSASLRPFG